MGISSAEACGVELARETPPRRPPGSVAVALLDTDGNELARSRPLTEDATETNLRWAGAFKTASLQGKEICLEFRLRSAKLYSFAFQE